MAAKVKLAHSAQSRNFLNSQIHQVTASRVANHGILTLFGYGINVRVERGHLICADGIGSERRLLRLARVGHGLRRLIIIGADGWISLAALRWLADQEAAFVMLERDGRVLATTGPVRPSDARLRRAQSLAAETGTNITIAQYLIAHKLAGQERIAREKRGDGLTADSIAEFRRFVESSDSLAAIRDAEAKAAAIYWAAWRDLPITFPKNELPRVPEHWQRFGARKSPLTGSQRLAISPPNAMLNYLYALLESESRLAAAALGLDPGLGFIHVDTPNRDSLACDLMEAIRPMVDGFVFDWIRRAPLKREWFFEERNGNCRLMGPLAAKLSETADTWRRAVAPFAEWVARTLWQRSSRPIAHQLPPTRLTQQHRRVARDGQPLPSLGRTARHEVVCRTCGKSIKTGKQYCPDCAVSYSTESLIAAARLGRSKSHTPEVEARRAQNHLRHVAAERNWNPSSLPAWLDREAYVKKIQPLLKDVRSVAIAAAMGVSRPYAVKVRHGRCVPNSRHWLALAKLTHICSQ